MEFSVSKGWLRPGWEWGGYLGRLGSPAGEEGVKYLPHQGIRFLGSRFLLEGVEPGRPLGLSVASGLEIAC